MKDYKIPEEIDLLLKEEQKNEIIDFHKIYNWIHKNYATKEKH